MITQARTAKMYNASAYCLRLLLPATTECCIVPLQKEVVAAYIRAARISTLKSIACKVVSTTDTTFILAAMQSDSSRLTQIPMAAA